jgi:hypothetical protein
MKIFTQKEINDKLQQAVDQIAPSLPMIADAASMAAKNQEWAYTIIICQKAQALHEASGGVFCRINREGEKK